MFLRLVAALLVSGCATHAQQLYKQTVEAYKAANSEAGQCVTSLSENPLFVPLSVHLALGNSPPTLEQQTDSAVATPDEVALLLKWHVGLQSCHDQYLSVAQEKFGFMVPATQENYLSYDAIFLKLAQRQITYGEANQQLSQARVAAAARRSAAQRSAAGKEWEAELNQENREELAQRQAAFQAAAQSLQEAAQRQHQIAQQQQLINALNRPTTTTCNSMGMTTNCMTH
jgi:hypothetical protein